MKIPTSALATAILAVALLGGCAATGSDQWPEAVPLPAHQNIPLDGREGGCFRPEGTYLICQLTFEYSDQLLQEVIDVFVDDGFTVAQSTVDENGWDLKRGDVTIQVRKGSSSSTEGYRLVDLNDQS